MRWRLYGSAVLILTVLMSVVSSSSGEQRLAPRVRYCSVCGSLSTHLGNGTLRISARGVTWVQHVNGQIVVRVRKSGTRWSVNGWRHRHHRDGRWLYQGRRMTLYINGSYTVTLRGSGISSGTVAAIGSGYIDARRAGGSYHLNGGRARRWPLAGRSLHLQR